MYIVCVYSCVGVCICIYIYIMYVYVGLCICGYVHTYELL